MKSKLIFVVAFTSVIALAHPQDVFRDVSLTNAQGGTYPNLYWLKRGLARYTGTEYYGPYNSGNTSSGFGNPEWPMHAVHAMLIPKYPGSSGTYQILAWGIGNGPDHTGVFVGSPHYYNSQKGAQFEIALYNDPTADNWSSANGSSMTVPWLRHFALEDPNLNCTIFCAGHILLPKKDPTVVTFGGTIATAPNNPIVDNYGTTALWRFKASNQGNGYNPQVIQSASSQSTLPWRFLGQLDHCRYYPTAVNLPCGRQLIIGGNDENGPRPIFTTRFTTLYSDEPYGPNSDTGGAPYITHYVTDVPWPADTINYGYFVYPGVYTWKGSAWDNQIFILNEDPNNADYKMDLATFAFSKISGNTYSDQVMGRYPSIAFFDGKVMKSGGTIPNDPVTPATVNSAIYDMGASTPAWINGGDLQVLRTNHVTVPLPDSTMMIFGGNRVGLEGVKLDQRPPEKYSMASNSFTLLDGTGQPSRIHRAYHSSGLLLPNGMVWVSGGNAHDQHLEDWWSGANNNTIPQIRFDIWKPKYLTSGYARPTWTTGTGAVGDTLYYGDELPSSPISSWGSGFSEGYYCLTGMGASTHATDMQARFVKLHKNTTSNRWEVPTPEQTPPGWYMLWAVSTADSNGPRVSEAKVVRVVDHYTMRSPYDLTVTAGSFDNTDDETLGVGGTSADQRHLGAVIQGDGHLTSTGRAGWLRLKRTGSAGPITLQFKCYLPSSCNPGSGQTHALKIRLEYKKSSTSGTWGAPTLVWLAPVPDSEKVLEAVLGPSLQTPSLTERLEVISKLGTSSEDAEEVGSGPTPGEHTFTLTWPNVPVNGTIDVDELCLGAYQDDAE